MTSNDLSGKTLEIVKRKKTGVTAAMVSMIITQMLRIVEAENRRLPDSQSLRVGDSPNRRVGESFFDYEYHREFEAKIGTARNCVRVYRTSGVIFFIDYCTAIRDT